MLTSMILNLAKKILGESGKLCVQSFEYAAEFAIYHMVRWLLRKPEILIAKVQFNL
jgi:hypothetical protein